MGKPWYIHRPSHKICIIIIAIINIISVTTRCGPRVAAENMTYFLHITKFYAK